MIKMTPGRRFAFAFILGWVFHFACQIMTKSWVDDNMVGLVIATVCSFIVFFLYRRNKEKFELEHTFMMLKNPPEEEEPKNSGPPRRPPPPPAPPKRTYHKGIRE